ncbi:Aste57867_8434 [Aphanomyces stellatus]|uniref:Alpha-mannosidase n=1 Tax=Aphanomyces stellatus TaxID=120398 RepID=A0A485KKB3_9STRA|nr:hypothetical protein As57867_008402 [Aphanomyces stellatus]VFT85320.1 Aste57867_8434 [Aphanomyces stellatus]
MVHVRFAAAAAALSAVWVNAVPLPKCEHWSPDYPEDHHYQTSTSISKDKLNVHLIPHTHDDPGWLITVDQYFTQEVDWILDTVVDELLKNPNRRFMYVEQSFFQRWWREQTEGKKEIVKQLVKEGRLDLSVNGGWVMHDEATAHYSTMLDQTAFGHKFLLEEFGVIPRIGWQIDPFGHSSVQGSLLSAGVGFDALYFARIDYQDFDKRWKEKNLEFIWKPSASRDESVFTGMIQNGYGAPGGFYFESDPPIKDDPFLHDYNVCERVKLFLDQTLDRASHQKGNHVFWPMGTDFQYQNAHKWFKNMDKLIHYVNQEGRVNILYSTLEQYTDLKLKEKIDWSVKTDDFFPYADQAYGYWTGYFTSRPALKRYVRVVNSLLQSLRQLEVWSGVHETGVNHLAAVVGLSLHHDGVSGTEKQAVADDYAQRLGEGVGTALKVLSDIVHHPVEFCLLTNVSVCDASTTGKPFTFFVYNPLPHTHTYSVSLPLSTTGATVELANKTVVPSVVVPYVPVYPQELAHSLPNQLVVEATVPPLGWLVYHVTPKQNDAEVAAISGWDIVEDSILSAENEFVQVQVDSATGSLVSLTNKVTKTTVQVKSSLLYYQAFAKPNQDCSSGAYLFRPNTSAVHPLPAITTHNCQKNSIVQSCAFHFGDWGKLEYKLHAWDQSVLVDWTVGPIPIDDNQGREAILRFDTSIASEKKWYTDSNGLDFVERVRNYRETWNLTLHNDEEEVASNYVPITISTYLRDKSTQFNVITDRAQGVASLKDGSLELMVHRRLLDDDHKGVDEHLNETETLSLKNGKSVTQGLTVRGTVALSVGPHDEAMAFLRTEMERRYLSPLVGFLPAETKFDASNKSWAARLPPNVGLTSLEVKCKRCIRLRLTHLFGINEHPEWSKDATVDLKDLLAGHCWEKFSVKEISLSGNRELGTVDGSKVTLKALHVKAYEVCRDKEDSVHVDAASKVFDPLVSNLAESAKVVGRESHGLDF